MPPPVSTKPTPTPRTTTTGAVTKRRKNPTARKLLTLPTQPHERLTTLLARLDRPPPAFTIFEQKRFRAELAPGPPLRPKPPHVAVPWEGPEKTEPRWFMSVQDARRHAAEAACPALEKELRDTVTERQSGGVGTGGTVGIEKVDEIGAASTAGAEQAKEEVEQEEKKCDKYVYQTLAAEVEDDYEDMWMDLED